MSYIYDITNGGRDNLELIDSIKVFLEENVNCSCFHYEKQSNDSIYVTANVLKQFELGEYSVEELFIVSDFKIEVIDLDSKEDSTFDGLSEKWIEHCSTYDKNYIKYLVERD